MVEYITIAHGIAQRLSEKRRDFACTSAVITLTRLGENRRSLASSRPTSLD